MHSISCTQWHLTTSLYDCMAAFYRTLGTIPRSVCDVVNADPTFTLDYAGNAPSMEHCPSVQENAICSFVAATNIETVNASWSCSAAGNPVSDVCGWTWLACDGSRAVNQISLGSFSLTGNSLHHVFARVAICYDLLSCIGLFM